LNEVVDRAHRAKRPQDWQAGVVGPLRITASDLILGVERRQRGLDVQQEQFQREIASLIETDWFNAIDRCQQLLDETASTLQQLNELLLRHTHQIETLLDDILELASRAEARTAEAVVQRVMGQIDRVAAWGAARQEAWSEYYDYVHRYLRDVVRLDPARALTQRLRDQLAGQGARFALTYAATDPLTLLRTVTSVPDKPPVVRPRAARERELAADSGEDREATLNQKVQHALADGARALSQLTRVVTEELPVTERFLEAGRIAHSAAQHAHAKSAVDRPWVPAGEGLLIEEWSLERVQSEEGESDD
jgi:chromosome partition protein MukF